MDVDQTIAELRRELDTLDHAIRVLEREDPPFPASSIRAYRRPRTTPRKRKSHRPRTPDSNA